MTPIAQIAIALPRCSPGNICNMMDCDSGTSAAPNTPCRKRNSTICARLVAMPHSAEVMTNPAMLISKKRFCPMRSVMKPVSGMKIAEAIR